MTGIEQAEPGLPAAPEAAILLGGGRASRLGGIDKPALVVDGRALADHAFDAVRDCRPVIAVGPASLARDGVVLVCEDPPFGGPVAALAAGLRALMDAGADAAEGERHALGSGENEWVWLLACDLPRAVTAVALLRAHPPVGPDVDGVVLVDRDGREQWLAGRYRLRSLHRALDRTGETSGASMRRLTALLNLARVPDPSGASADLDTWEDVRRYRGRRSDDKSDHNGGEEGTNMPDQTTSPEDLDRWVAALGAELGVDVGAVPVGLLLDLTRDVAHGVARPAGPVSTFIVALAAARDGGTPEAVERAASATRALAATWAR